MPFKDHYNYLTQVEEKEQFIILHAVISPTCVGYHHSERSDKHILFVYIDKRRAPRQYPDVVYHVAEHLCYREVYQNHAYTGYPLHALFSGWVIGSAQAMAILKSQQVIKSDPEVYKTLELLGGIYYDSQRLANTYLKHARHHYINIKLQAHSKCPVRFLYLLVNCLAVRQCHYYVKFTFDVERLIDQSHLVRRVRSLLKELYSAYLTNTFTERCQDDEYEAVIELLYDYAKLEGENQRPYQTIDHSVIEKAYRQFIVQYD